MSNPAESQAPAADFAERSSPLSAAPGQDDGQVRHAKTVKLLKSALLPLIQVIGCVTAFWIVVRLDLINFALIGSLLGERSAVATAVAIGLATVPIAALRWHLILRSAGIAVPFKATLRITAVTLAGNAIILGGFGGEVVRLAFAARSEKGTRGAAAITIVMDRILALLGVLIFGSAAALANIDAIVHSPVLQFGAMLLAAGLLACLIVVAIVVAGRHDALARLVQRWLGPSWLANICMSVAAAMLLYRRSWRTLLIGLALSILVTVGGVLALRVFCQVSTDLGFLRIGFASSLATIANMVPISPGGLGVGEGVFAKLCAILNGGAATAAFGTAFLSSRAVATATLIVAGLLGLIQRWPRRS